MKNFLSSNNLNIYILLLILLILIFRIFSIFVSPLEISADEAQYWLWSQKFEFGYFSKPPMIAWLISISNFIFGDSISYIRLFSPIINFFTGVILFILFKEIFNKENYNSLIVILIWLTMPIVGVGSFLISTDTPLLFFWSLSLLFIYYSIKNNRLSFWLMAGLFSGLAVLSKYAGLFLLLGVILYNLFNKSKRHSLLNFGAYIIGLIITSCPSIIWNINNNFYTIRHLSDNAVIDSPKYSLNGAIQFLFDQIFVIGPIMFLVFILSIFSLNKKISWLIWFIFPVFILMTIQGFFSEANANWAASALPGICIFCSFLLQKKKFFSISSISINIIFSITLIMVSIFGNITQFGPKSDPLRKLKGWQDLSEIIIDKSEKYKVNHFVVNRRGIAAPLIYYLRDSNIQIRLIPIESHPKNHYELNYSLKKNEAKKIILISEKNTLPVIWQDSMEVEKLATHIFDVSKNKKRELKFSLIKLTY